MKTRILAVLLLLTGSAHAQHERDKQYLDGAGMGYARAAEQNHFPGPMHVLELADQLKLTGEQRSATQRLMETHKAQARGIGAELVTAERELEQLFRGGNVDEGALARAARTTAALEGEYRLAHLETHRRMRGLLSEEQLKRYDELRGYGSSKAEQHRH
jgi:Spy/CpxP family protein refolding chaperone